MAETVTDLQPEIRETLKSVRTAADTVTVVATVVLVAVALAMLVDLLDGGR